MCSFDIKSLFTNVPLQEAINITADALYNNFSLNLKLKKQEFINLMEMATNEVEFSFNNVIYRQIDGVAMGSPLGPALANVFVGYQEEKLFNIINHPRLYFRYVDDTFALFKDQSEMDEFYKQLNLLHPSLQFTREFENKDELPFLDVLVKSVNNDFVTSIYRKATFTGHYVKWNSFCDKKRKFNIIRTLVHRALHICSPMTLEQELKKITKILIRNGYPGHVVKRTIDNKISTHQQNKTPVEGPRKCPVYMRLPYIGSVSEDYSRRIKQAVSRCFGAVEPRVVLKSQPMFPSATKDVLPTLYKSNVVYKYTCCCDRSYVGKTEQILLKRIREHIPLYVEKHLIGWNSDAKMPTAKPSMDKLASSIARHLLENPKCGLNYSDEQFKIISYARNAFHLSVLEALFITRTDPVLCRQKKFVYNCTLF